MNWLIQSWYRRSLLSYVIWPLSLFFRTVVFLRKILYKLHIKKTFSFTVPIIVIGNISVGGTGKTPLVIELARFLCQLGYRPGIVSRGYKSRYKIYPQWITPESNPRDAGDEPVLLAQRTGCPVVIAPSRVTAVKTLLGRTECDIILSDDGLQHYALARDIEIAVIDGKRRFGNHFYLPAGPLRESLTRLKTVDFRISHGAAEANEFGMQLAPQEIYSLLDSGRKLQAESFDNPVHAVAGIGNPERFFQQLRNMGFSIIPHIFPDHHFYKPQDIGFADNALIIMTEKDAVKCREFADIRHYCLRVSARIEDAFYRQFREKIAALSKNLPR